MADEVTIRAARREDCETLSALTRELGYASTADSALERLEQLLASESDAVLVAVIGDVVAGWMHLSHVVSLESDPFVEIRGLVVADGHRSRGIGARLVSAGEQWARSRRVTRVRVRSNVVRTEARRFYERLGYSVTKTQNVFDRDIGT